MDGTDAFAFVIGMVITFMLASGWFVIYTEAVIKACEYRTGTECEFHIIAAPTVKTTFTLTE